DVVQGVILRDVVAAAEHPDLAGVDDGGVVGPRRPRGTGRLQLPLLAVGGGPEVVFEALLIAEVVILRAAEYPQPALEDDLPAGVARLPPGPVRHLDPVRRLALAEGGPGGDEQGGEDDRRPFHAANSSLCGNARRNCYSAGCFPRGVALVI